MRANIGGVDMMKIPEAYGWLRLVETAASNRHGTRHIVVYISPSGERFLTRQQLQKYLTVNRGPSIEYFDFRAAALHRATPMDNNSTSSISAAAQSKLERMLRAVKRRRLGFKLVQASQGQYLDISHSAEEQEDLLNAKDELKKEEQGFRNIRNVLQEEEKKVLQAIQSCKSEADKGTNKAACIKSLFPVENKSAVKSEGLSEELSEPSGTTKATSVKDVLNGINAALYANHFSGPRIVGREEQTQQLREFLKGSKDKNPGCTIIAGTPGTGKSLTTRFVLDELLAQYKDDKTRAKDIPEIIEINCMQIGGDARSVIGRLESSICPERRRSSVESESRVETRRRSSGRCDEVFISKALKDRIIVKSGKKAMRRVIVLEEADRLLTGGETSSSTLRELICLCQASASNTTLIAICNALDIYQKLFHSTGLGSSTKNSPTPHIIHFSPYNVDQISQIIRNKIQGSSHGYEKYFKGAAIELCARRIAAASGDIRRAVEACTCALQLAQIDRGETLDEPISAHCESDQCLIDVKHMASALSQNLNLPVLQCIKRLSIQQQMILVAILGSNKDNDGQHGEDVKSRRISTSSVNSSEPSLLVLHRKYNELCRKANLSETSSTDLLEMCNTLEAHGGLIHIKPNKDRYARRIALKTSSEDIKFALQNSRIFKTLIGSM